MLASCNKPPKNMNKCYPPLELIFEQPCLDMKKEGNTIIYTGSLIVKYDMFKIELKEQRDNDISSFEVSSFEFINVDKSMENFPGMLEDIKHIKAVNIMSYLKAVEKIILTHKPPFKFDIAAYMKVYHELKEFSSFYIDLKKLEYTGDLSEIKVSFVDEGNRNHQVEIGVNFDEPVNMFYLKNLNVPHKNEKKVSSNLKELYKMHLEHIGNLQPFFEFMDMIDNHCTVLDPKECSRTCTYRRVLLEKNGCVLITVDPFNMNSCPCLAFLGPNKLIDIYIRRIEENISNWDVKGHIFEQLLLVLGIENFPKEKAISLNQYENILKTDDNDCNICFLYNYKDHIPDITCENPSCGNLYHRECLYEWLSSVEYRKNFGEIEGECPDCDKTITCPIVDN